MSRIALIALTLCASWLVAGGAQADEIYVGATVNPAWPSQWSLKAPAALVPTNFVIRCPLAIATPARGDLASVCPGSQWVTLSQVKPTDVIGVCLGATASSTLASCDVAAGGGEGWQVASAYGLGTAPSAGPAPAKCRFVFGTTPWHLAMSDKDYAVVWFCPGKYTWTWQPVSGPLSEVSALLADVQAAIQSPDAFDAAWSKNMQGPETDRARRDMVDTLVSAYRPPDPVWAVANYSRPRPTYPLNGAVRVTKSNGHIVPGVTCDCRTTALEEGTSTYCSVAGRDNADTPAVDALPPGTVALCTANP